MSNLSRLQQSIGFEFADSELLSQALTHRSFGGNNYERLEFLGDSVLNLTITTELYSRFPSLDEGELSRMRAGLVNQKTLADIARELDLGSYLIMGAGELKSGGFRRDSILSDALEAIFGAVYLAADFLESADCIRRLYQSRLASLNAEDNRKDPKSQLQEYLQGIAEPVPDYVLLNTRGKAPDQQFDVECRVTLLKAATNATGTSRRKAEQEAASLALEALKAQSLRSDT